MTKQYLREDQNYVNLDKGPGTGAQDGFENDQLPGDEVDAESDNAESEGELDVDERIFRIFHPSNSASSALNVCIRLLILKLPLQQLHTFWYILSLPYVHVFYISLILTLGGITLVHSVRILFRSYSSIKGLQSIPLTSEPQSARKETLHMYSLGA